MAGIYVHVPFCRRPCAYCNFYFSTGLGRMDDFVRALVREVALRAPDLGGEPVGSVYIGGGTPSLLNADQLTALFRALHAHVEIEEDAEITLEANPDDLDDGCIDALAASPVNRLSIGVQSFRDDHLTTLDRIHSAREALDAVERARTAGIHRLSIDLIYGLPGLADDVWLDALCTARDLGVDHLSCYALTVEENTRLYHDIRKGKHPPVDPDLAARHFHVLADWADQSGWDHYEVSNLCRPGHRAVHNSGYWTGMRYLGLGPAAHSYDGLRRRWNRSDLRGYVRALDAGDPPPADEEWLTPADRFNESVMTGLRMRDGLDLDRLESMHPDLFAAAIPDAMSQVNPAWAERTDGHLRLTRDGLLHADGIAAHFFITHP